MRPKPEPSGLELLQQAQVVVEVFQKIGVDYATANRLLARADDWAVLWPLMRLGCKLQSVIEQAIFCLIDAVRAYNALTDVTNAPDDFVAAKRAVARSVKLARIPKGNDNNAMMAFERLCKYVRPLMISETDKRALLWYKEKQSQWSLKC